MFCLLNLAFFFLNACLLLMFDSEKYNPSCTVNFETIRGDFQYVEKKKKIEAPYRLTLSFCPYQSVFLFFFFLVIQLCFLSWVLMVKETCVVVFCTAALDHKLKLTSAAVLQG